MSKIFSPLLLCLILLVVVSSVAVLAEVSVGVKEGDWIEYNVTYTGSPLDEYPKWVKIEITNIQGTNITAELTVERLDGTSGADSGTFDLETGVPDLLLIPAGLDIGDEFYNKDFGNITIVGKEEHTYAGEKRTVIYATVDQITLHWDKTTGILLQSDQSADNFTQKLVADRTNMWQAQVFGLGPTTFYVVIVAIVAIIAIVGIFLFLRRR